MDRRQLAAMMDFTVLSATAQPADIERLCADAIELGAASVCVNPCYVERVAGILRGSSVKACAVAGFPLGSNVTASKADEAERAAALGATEVDVVAATHLLLGGDLNGYERQIEAVRLAVPRVTLKVIIETACLNAEQIAQATALCVAAGADFVKTSSGFAPRGASVEDIELIAAAIASAPTSGRLVRIKASGGIRTLDQCLQLVEAGAARLGVSGYRQILDSLKK